METVKALKSLVPYFLIAALMWLFWLCNSNAERLPFVNIDLWAALFYLAPLLPLLMGGIIKDATWASIATAAIMCVLSPVMAMLKTGDPTTGTVDVTEGGEDA